MAVGVQFSIVEVVHVRRNETYATQFEHQLASAMMVVQLMPSRDRAYLMPWIIFIVVGLRKLFLQNWNCVFGLTLLYS